MTSDLRVLLVEDSADDAELLLREFRRGGYTPLWLRVQTRDEMREALARQTWDLVLADYSLPNFSAPEAFAVLKETGAVVGTQGGTLTVHEHGEEMSVRLWLPAS